MKTSIPIAQAQPRQKPIIAVTMGDAAGVGPELCLRLLANRKLHRDALPLVIGSDALLARAARSAALAFDALCVSKLTGRDARPTRPAVLDIAPDFAAEKIQPGKNQALCGKLAGMCIREAVRGCLQGDYAAMVTAPISKKALNMAGIDFPGHTEMLADLTSTKNYAMLLYSDEIACAFATCHQSLKSVARSLSVERVVEVARLAWENVCALRRNQTDEPPRRQGAKNRNEKFPSLASLRLGGSMRLCLLGLNPHAGEEGLFGDEEKRILIPAKKKIEKLGIPIDGPLPPDTAFTPQARARYACYIAIYHDQGSIPFKMLAFDSGVNITLGLPIIRTSPDHGTAFDIAWQGIARPDSFFAAYDMAARLASNSKGRTRKENGGSGHK